MPNRAGAIVAPFVWSARVVLQERLNDELTRWRWRLGPTQPRAEERWDNPSGWVGTEPGPTFSSFDGRASHSLPNS
jgi:hypothetical protein